MAEAKVLDNAALESIATRFLCAKGTCTDANASMVAGIYRCDNAENTPYQWGVLVHGKTSSSPAFQLFFGSNGRMYQRVNWNTWSAWLLVTATA